MVLGAGSPRSDLALPKKGLPRGAAAGLGPGCATTLPSPYTRGIFVPLSPAQFLREGGMQVLPATKDSGENPKL